MEDNYRIINIAGLSFYENSSKIEIRSIFDFNKFNIGILLIIVLAIFVLYILLRQSTFYFAIFLGALVALVILIGGILALLKQLTDYLIVTPEEVSFRNSLIKRSFELNPNLQVKMKASKQLIKSNRPGLGSKFTVVELFLINDGKEYRFLDFSVDEVNTKDAMNLGTEIISKLKMRIRSSQSY